MNDVPRHKVFLSYHHDIDQDWKDQFISNFGGDFIDKSVHQGDIDDENLKVEAIRQTIRDDYISDATVTVVLIGPCTWQRKHVDWEISSSLRHTDMNPRCGLLGILLPSHFDATKRRYNPRRIPPRLADNTYGNDPFAKVYNWTDDAASILRWIHTAFQRRNGTPPDNRRVHFGRNRSGNCVAGWPD